MATKTMMTRDEVCAMMPETVEVTRGATYVATLRRMEGESEFKWTAQIPFNVDGTEEENAKARDAAMAHAVKNMEHWVAFASVAECQIRIVTDFTIRFAVQATTMELDKFATPDKCVAESFPMRDASPFDVYMSSDKEPPIDPCTAKAIAIGSAYLANPSGEE